MAARTAGGSAERARASADSGVSILRSKITMPAAPDWAVPRPRLDQLIAGGVQGPLTALMGPPGMGKTLAMASWAAVFLVDMWMYRRRDGYAESDLYSVTGRYGAYNWAGIISFVVAVFFGLGLVTSGSPIFKGWVGYLLGPFGGKSGTVAYSSIGLLVAFVVAAGLYAILSGFLTPRALERTVVVP